ncbi:hypothetical protein QOZ80_2BG0183690 [Eleusine coracana subsp. coracana]|nr:hypothetical protein QOZ80_2BG0183690 [Eleusine coracana subsp. coracana]
MPITAKRGAMKGPGEIPIAAKRGAMKGPGEMRIAAKRDEGKSSGDCGSEYPCVNRFRYRRLISFLWLQGFEGTVSSMLRESDAIFSVRHLKQLVLRGQWYNASRYLSRFLPLNDDSARLQSVEAVVLCRFLAAHCTVAYMVAGPNRDGLLPAKFSHYLDHSKTISHGALRLRSIMLNVSHSRHQIRASRDWERVRRKAADIVRDLAYQTPELKGIAFLPCGPMDPHNVLPIGFGFRQRYYRDKQARRPTASAIAKHYLGKRMSLPASSSQSQESADGKFTESKVDDWLADILDESLKAGKLPEHDQACACPIQTSAKEGATVAPAAAMIATSPAKGPAMPSVANAVIGAAVPLVSQTLAGSLAGPAQNRGMPSVASAVTAGTLGSHVPTSVPPFLGTMLDAPVSQNVFRSLTHHDQDADAIGD